MLNRLIKVQNTDGGCSSAFNASAPYKHSLHVIFQLESHEILPICNFREPLFCATEKCVQGSVLILPLQTSELQDRWKPVCPHSAQRYKTDESRYARIYLGDTKLMRDNMSALTSEIQNWWEPICLHSPQRYKTDESRYVRIYLRYKTDVPKCPHSPWRYKTDENLYICTHLCATRLIKANISALTSTS